MKTFLTSYFQVFFVAINTLLIARGYILGVFIVSFIISLLWAFNVSKISVSTTNQKLTYAFGAGCGAVSGLHFIDFFIHLIEKIS